jgi:hypothetical protein
MGGSPLQRSGVDRVLDALSAHHRRLILLELRAGRAEHVTDVLLREGDEDTALLELEHNHLPRLTEAGYVEWDRETGALSRGPNFSEVAPVLALLEDHADELPPDWP